MYFLCFLNKINVSFEACVLVNCGGDGNSHLTEWVLFLFHFLKCNKKRNMDYLETSVAD